jgi:hypothetical protein
VHKIERNFVRSIRLLAIANKKMCVLHNCSTAAIEKPVPCNKQRFLGSTTRTGLLNV